MPDLTKGNCGQIPALSDVLAQRGVGYHDAFEHDPFSAATHVSIGPATPILAGTFISSGVAAKPDVPLDDGTFGAMGRRVCLVLIWFCVSWRTRRCVC